jgi:hypothetical protein
MLNESTETISCNNLEIVLIPLSSNNILNLELRFTQTNKKKYLIREALIIDSEVISEQVELAKIKSFIRKFIHQKNNSSHENKIFEYTTKQNPKGDTIRSLRLKKIFGNNIYFSEIDIEAILSVWLDALVGYSKIRVFDKNIIFYTNRYYAKLQDDKVFTQLDRDINAQIFQNLKHNEFDSSTIVELIENAKIKQ